MNSGHWLINLHYNNRLYNDSEYANNSCKYISFLEDFGNFMNILTQKRSHYVGAKLFENFNIEYSNLSRFLNWTEICVNTNAIIFMYRLQIKHLRSSL
jgi:hypothetical protein